MKIAGRSLDKRLAVVGCKHTTRDLILGLERRGIQIDHCITLSPEKAQRQQVAGYMDLAPFLHQRAIPSSHVHKYNMDSDEDRAAMLALKLDILLVMGWQRLIPSWFLQSLSIGAFGMHGSSKPLPHGRGRSPMNWSLIQNKQTFYTHLFRYCPGVDDGDIVAVQQFDITPFDTCLTLHHKNTVSMTQLCAQWLPALVAQQASLTPQPREGASYYPKRTAEDGLIFWTDSSLDIYNLVRAVTRPFPGAFAFLENDVHKKILIWRAIPFDTQLQWPGAQPGEIVEVFFDGTFVVKTGDTSLLVQEYEGHPFTAQDVGRLLGNAGQGRKDWGTLPD